jgi:hypothetical protein
VSLDLGETTKLGNFPVIKFFAPPQFIDSSIGVSSISGSYNAGNLRGIISKTLHLISFRGDLNTGGPDY